MGTERWAVNVHSQWRDSGFVAFDLVRLSYERLKPHETFGAGHRWLRVSVLGLSLSVVRYGA